MLKYKREQFNIYIVAKIIVFSPKKSPKIDEAIKIYYYSIIYDWMFRLINIRYK